MNLLTANYPRTQCNSDFGTEVIIQDCGNGTYSIQILDDDIGGIISCRVGLTQFEAERLFADATAPMGKTGY